MFLLTMALAAFFFSCGNLEKEIDLDLPLYESQIVVECYLKPNEPFSLLLTKSAAYFEPFPTEDLQFVEKILEQDATVTIRHNGQAYELKNELVFNPVTQKVFNYHNPQLVPQDYDNDFFLEIKTKDGRTVTGQTRLLPVVPIDSVVVEFDLLTDTLARVLTYITEDPSTDNYYRRMLHVGALDSIPKQDFTTNDDFVEDNLFIFGSGFDFKPGDTVINSIFHIDREYFDFLESIFFATDANGNPFGQPAAIYSNVSGNAIGIFTGLSVDRVVTVIER